MPFTPEKTNQVVIDSILDKEILLGYCNREAYLLPRYKRWFDDWYEKQEPEKYYTDKLHQEFFESLSITIFTASWCGRCRTELARFYKIWDNLKMSFHQVTVIYVNKNKEVPGLDVSGYNLTRVPTFLFYRNSEEIARITEQPKDTLEAEFFRIQTDFGTC